MKRKTIATITCLLLAISLLAQSSPYKKPRLVLFITIDGMKTEHISALYQKFKEGGLKKLISDGAYLQNIDFNYIAKGDITDIASLCTSTTPSQHGIIDSKLFSTTNRDFISIVKDDKYHGLSTSVGRSPKNVAAATFSDALKMAEPKAKIYSIGIDADKAIVMAGHNADGVVWIDNEAKIGSTDYYFQMPLWASNLNASGILNNYLRSIWLPMYSIKDYKYPVCNATKGRFYTPQKKLSNDELIEKFRYTTYANTIIKDLAQKAIKDEGLGLDKSTDILCLNFNINTFANNTSELNCAEKEDLYLSLDRDLEILFKDIQQHIGFDQTLIVVAGTQAEPLSQETLIANRLAVGKFDGKKIMALLNSLLMAKYGQFKWVLNYANGNIYLNNAEIKRQNIDDKELKQDAVRFLTTVHGISFASTYDNIKQTIGEPTELTVRLRNSTFAGRSGDIIITLNNGWLDIDLMGKQSIISTTALQQTPVIFYGINIAKSNVLNKYYITDIANTICRIMQIPPPSSSIGQSIFLNTNQQ